MLSSKANKIIYCGEVYEVRYSDSYKANYVIYNQITECNEAYADTLPDAITKMTALENELLELVSEEDFMEIERNTAVATSLASDNKEPF